MKLEMSVSHMAVIPAPERLRQEDYKLGVSVNGVSVNGVSVKGVYVNSILRPCLPKPKETKILSFSV